VRVLVLLSRLGVVSMRVYGAGDAQL